MMVASEDAGDGYGGRQDGDDGKMVMMREDGDDGEDGEGGRQDGDDEGGW